MAVRFSRGFTDLVTECKYVLSAFDTESDQVAETLTGLTQPNLTESDEAPGFRSVFVGLRRNMNASLLQVAGAVSKVSEALGWESTLRKEYQAKSDEQARHIVALRNTVAGQYVDPDLENLSLQPVDVRTPPVMATRSQLISERFEAPNLSKMLGQAHFEEPVDLDPYVTQVRVSAQELAVLGELVNEAERRTARARKERNDLQNEHEKIVLRSARILEDFCRLAGDDVLADKIRKSVRSTSSSPEPGEDEPVEGDEG